MSMSVRMLAAGTALTLAGGLMAGSAVAEPTGDTRADTRTTTPEAPPSATTVARRIDDHGAKGQRVADYWTPARMAAAKPADQKARPGDLQRMARIPKDERVAPGTGAKPIAGDVDKGSDTARKTYSRRVGKMFYKFGKQNWVCSGAVVNSKKKNMVFTAAHCLWDKKKKWAKKVMFVPGYKKGKRPYGTYYAKLTAIPKRWKKWGGRSELPQADYGIMLVKKVGGGKRIARRVGAYGLQWGRKFKRKYKATGYPAFRTGGGVQKSCKARGRKWKKYSNPKAGWGLVRMPCRAVTGGSSGGPWLHKGYINGQNALVNSFKKPRWVATPWFAGGVKKLYRAYRNKNPK